MSSNVRSVEGTPVAGDFIGGGGTPIIVDRTSGAERLFILNASNEIIEMAAAVPYDIRVAQGLVTGASAFYKFGRSSVIDTTDTYIANVGGAAPYMPTSAVGVEILSSTATDTSAGVGARSVTITGLNSLYVVQSETIATNGATPVTAINTYVRVYSAVAETDGTYGGSNAGDITIRQIGGGTSFLKIGIGLGRSQSSHYCVPSGYSLYVNSLIVSPETSKVLDFTAYIRQNADDVSAPVKPLETIVQFDGMTYPIQFVAQPQILIPEKSDIWAVASVTVATGHCSVQYFGYLIAN